MFFIKNLNSTLHSDKKRLNAAKENLKKCWKITTTEDLNKHLDFLCNELQINKNWKNKRVSKEEYIKNKKRNSLKKPIELDKKTKKKLYNENPLDLKLYRYAKEIIE